MGHDPKDYATPISHHIRDRTGGPSRRGSGTIGRKPCTSTKVDWNEPVQGSDGEWNAALPGQANGTRSFPQVWLMVDRIARALVNGTARYKLGGEIAPFLASEDGARLYGAERAAAAARLWHHLAQNAKRWRDEATRTGLVSAPPPDRSFAFRTWLSELGATASCPKGCLGLNTKLVANAVVAGMESVAKSAASPPTLASQIPPGYFKHLVACTSASMRRVSSANPASATTTTSIVTKFQAMLQVAKVHSDRSATNGSCC